MQYDIEAVKANLATAITEARANLEQLETQQTLIDQHGDTAMLLIQALNRFGKVKPPKTNGTPSADALAGHDENAVVIKIITEADAPLRVPDLIARASGTLDRFNTSTKKRSQLLTKLAYLSNKGLVKKMGAGLYWRPNGPIAQSPEATTKAGKPRKRSTKVIAEELIARVEQIVPTLNGGKDLTTQDVLEAVEASHFEFGGMAKKSADHRFKAVASALSRSKHIKKTGHARGVRYHAK